ncbi:hypothetical protein F5Y18DRAFT_424362 [Xylariaceae sp. FL1019]|nr:hypothetical protein F5Y18DRAFT_424362 [Xylariaceae sp. FL1019]
MSSTISLTNLNTVFHYIYIIYIMKYVSAATKALLLEVAIALPPPNSLNTVDDSNNDSNAFHHLSSAEIEALETSIPIDVIDPFNKDFFGADYSTNASINGMIQFNIP